MTRHLFVMTDGSAVGDAALPLASRLARAEGAAVTVAHVLPQPVGVYEGPFAMEDRRARSSARASGQRVLAAAVAVLGHETRTLLLETRGQDVAACLLEAAERERADLIMMSTHGRSGLGKLLLGSVAERVMRGARIPVLLLRHP